jgi:hypothetical protein
MLYFPFMTRELERYYRIDADRLLRAVSALETAQETPRESLDHRQRSGEQVAGAALESYKRHKQLLKDAADLLRLFPDSVSTSEMSLQLDVSPLTALRLMNELMQVGKVRRVQSMPRPRYTWNKK